MSAAAVIPVTSAPGVQFIRYRPDQAKQLGRGPAKLLELLEFRAQKDGATFHCRSQWLEWKLGYSDRHVSRMLGMLIRANKLSTKMAGNGLQITVLRYAKMAEEVRQNGVPSSAPSINLPREENPKNSNSTTAAAAANPQAEKQNPKITEMPDPEAVAELTQRGVWPSVARNSARLGKQRVLDAIAYLQQADGVRNPAAFLVTAIREGWKIPPTEPAPAPAMRKCVDCSEFFDSALEGWHDGRCLRCAEKLERSVEDTLRPSEDGGQAVSGQSPGTDERQRIARMGPRISATVQKEQKLRLDAESLPRSMETQTPVSIARGRPAAVWEPKCRKCGLPITAEKLGTHGIHFACDEWSRG